MILTGSEDIRVKRTITSIHRAFSEMICEMDYDKITVKELCERAMINKKTFYTYYETLDFLLREVQESYSSLYLSEIRAYTIPADIGQLISKFFEFSARQDKTYERITCTTSYRGIRNEMIDQVMIESTGKKMPVISTKLTGFQNKVVYQYWFESVLMIYKEWIDDGKKIPMEDVITLAKGLILNGVNNFIR